DLGEHRLKDLGAPRRIFQLGHDEFPPLKSLDQTNLPVHLTPLVGRERELAEASALLRAHRLLTLVGPGGTGKTRLALQLAADSVGDFEDGVFWVPLATTRDPDLVPATIAQVVGSRNGLEDHLRGRRLLLVLDNMEQVLAAADRLAALLEAALGTKLLVTSREPLRLSGEQQYLVPPLEQDDAVALFVERARSVSPEFEADAAVYEICRRLDGLPLAIELAAARVKVLSAPALLARLEQRLPLLTSGRRDAPERQKTLRATIAWSHDLLTDEEKTFFARFAVFAGGCTLEAAEEICAPDLDTLESLVDKSLVRHDRDRYSMLDTIREYAHERLVESGLAEEVGEAHARFYRALAERAAPELRGPDDTYWLATLADEYGNLREALRRAASGRGVELGLRMAIALWRYWYVRGPLSEGVRTIGELLAITPPDFPSEVRAAALRALGALVLFAGQQERARSAYEEALELAREADDDAAVAEALEGLGSIAHWQGEFDAADTLAREALEIAERIRDEYLIAKCLHLLAEVARDRRDYSRAQELFERSLALSRQLGSKHWQANTLHSLGDLALDQRALPTAARLYRESLGLYRTLADERGVAYCLAGLAASAATQSDAHTAALLWGALEELEERIGARLMEDERGRYEACLAAASRELASETYDETLAAGRALSLDDAVRLAEGAVPG
ncbi:MAG: tetratricopeptide repeat protein, partial [Actinomycetota bacterium]|nr:tetratricopeptide repeat protein [Actinomycetota bacterium]